MGNRWGMAISSSPGMLWVAMNVISKISAASKRSATLIESGRSNVLTVSVPSAAVVDSVTWTVVGHSGTRSRMARAGATSTQMNQMATKATSIRKLSIRRRIWALTRARSTSASGDSAKPAICAASGETPSAWAWAWAAARRCRARSMAILRRATSTPRERIAPSTARPSGTQTVSHRRTANRLAV